MIPIEFHLLARSMWVVGLDVDKLLLNIKFLKKGEKSSVCYHSVQWLSTRRVLSIKNKIYRGDGVIRFSFVVWCVMSARERGRVISTPRSLIPMPQCENVFVTLCSGAQASCYRTTHNLSGGHTALCIVYLFIFPYIAIAIHPPWGEMIKTNIGAGLWLYSVNKCCGLVSYYSL